MSSNITSAPVTQPAYDPDAERAILGGMMLSPDVIAATDDLSREHFCSPNDLVFDAITSLYASRKPVLAATVTAELRSRRKLTEAGGAGYVTSLSVDASDSPTIARYFADQLRELWSRREARAIAAGVVAALDGGSAISVLDEAMADADKLREKAGRVTPATILAERRFNPLKPPPPARPIFRLCDAVIATPGNLVVISAQAKTGKTALLGAMIAATMDPTGDTLGVYSTNPEAGALIHFDTEQSPCDHHMVITQALKRAARPAPDWLRSYRLADVGIDERMRLLRFELEAARKAHRSIHSALLDGVADFCRDPNDTEEAFALVGDLHKLAIEYDTAILCVLHENPGSLEGKTRGHLGSQLERKSETNLRLAKDGDAVTVVFSEKSRHAHISKDKGPRFTWSEDAMMHVSVETAATTKAQDRRAELHDVAAEVFRDTPTGLGLTWEQLHQRIEQTEGLKRSGARKKYKVLLNAGVIRQTGDKYRLA